MAAPLPIMLRLRWLLVILLAAVPASAEYKLFLRQTAGLWQDAEKWLHCTLPPCGADASSDNYSILDRVETLVPGSGEYMLRLVYPKGGTGHPAWATFENWWVQTSAPTKDLGVKGKPPGYRPIDVHWPGGSQGETDSGLRGLT